MKHVKYRSELWKVILENSVLGDAAEVGVAEGYFALDILRWPIPIPILYLVDRWASVPTQKGDASQSQEWHDKNLSETRARAANHGFGDRVRFLRGESHVMADSVPSASLCFVNIDCDHSYQGVMRDIVAWWPKLVPGGVMAFHDYENPAYGVKRAVQDFFVDTIPARSREVHLLPENKPEDAGAYVIC